jgi:hypothetical protein
MIAGTNDALKGKPCRQMMPLKIGAADVGTGTA